eukprot:gene7769-9235_t
MYTQCVLKPPVDNSTEQQGNHQLFGETSLPQFLQQAEAAGFANPFLGLTPSDYTDFRNQQPNPDHMPSVSYILDFYGGKWQQACRAADISCDKLTNAVQQGRMLRFLNEQSAGGLTMKMYVQVSQASRRYCQQSLPSLQELRREFGSWQEACRSKCGGDGRRWQKPRRFNEACITASVKEFLCWAEKTPTVPVPSRGAYTLWRDQMMQDDPSMVGALPTISTIQAFCRSRRSHGLPSNWISFVCELYESMDTECSMHVE